jgi:predicted nucleotidyltransferase
MNNAIPTKHNFSLKSIYNGDLSNNNWLLNNVLYITLHGSHAYGTNIEGSDTDYRGFVVAPKEYYLGYQKTFENYVQNEPDLTLFEIRKFFNLCLKANPNALEILFTDESDHLYVSPLAQKIIDNKEMFLSKKVKFTFSGYATAQLKNIQRHRNWILNPPKGLPDRTDLGLPEKSIISKNQLEAVNAAIRKQLDTWNWHNLESVEPSVRQEIKDQFETMLLEVCQWNWIDLDDKIWLSAAHQIGLDTNMIEVLSKERVYNSKLKEWSQYNDWKKNRNPVRAVMEEKHGFDCKNALHLIRLSRMCKELLETGKMNVKRPDAEELIYIRNGGWSYEQVMDYTQNMEKEINKLYLKSNILPESPNYDLLEKICIHTIEKSF